jgi:hypothetical protein
MRSSPHPFRWKVLKQRQAFLIIQGSSLYIILLNQYLVVMSSLTIFSLYCVFCRTRQRFMTARSTRETRWWFMIRGRRLRSSEAASVISRVREQHRSTNQVEYETPDMSLGFCYSFLIASTGVIREFTWIMLSQKPALRIITEYIVHWWESWDDIYVIVISCA